MSCRANLGRAIARRLDGDRRVRIDLDLRGHTDFERDVWQKALEIPRGEVRPYGWIAAEIGRPKAVRAVGTALGHNPVPLIVPCHRVVRTDGSIGQYSLGGPANKRTILAAEGLDPDAMEAAARPACATSGRTRPTSSACRPASTPGGSRPPHRVPFRSLAGRRRGRLPAVPGLPAGVRGDRGLTPAETRRGTVRHVHSGLGPAVYANRRPVASPAVADLDRPADPVRRLGLDLPRDRHRDRHDPAVPDGGDPVPDRRRRPARVVGRPRGPGARPPVGRANGATARSSGPCCSAAGWAWSRSASRPSRPGSRRC